MQDKMMEVYKQVSAKYQNCAFGYVDNGLFMQLSVVSKRYKKNNTAIRQVELGKELQFYANQWMDMIREIHSENVAPKKTGEVQRDLATI